MSENLNSTPLGRPFTVLAVTESSNNYAMEALKRGEAQHGSAWFAMEQTSGRGQRGKTWVSEPGQNIILSVVIDPSRYNVNKPFELNWSFALAAHKLFSQFTGGDCSIKWPNDIMWRDRKAAGLLIDTIFRGTEWNFAVAGMGMNINQVRFPETSRKPVSLRQITGRVHDPLELTKRFLQLLQEELEFHRNAGSEAVLERYNQHLFGIGKETRFQKDNIVFTSTVIGVNSANQLCLKTPAGHPFNHGEIEWIIE